MKSVVHNILEALVQEWGFEHVSRCLDEAEEKGSLARRGEKPNPRYQKPSATDQVTKLDIDGPRKNLLSEIAKRFDEKTFLPRLSDVRHFVEMKGELPRALKQRPDAFRVVLKILQEMPAEGLERVLRDRSYNGPSRLGPLSKAINQANLERGARLLSNENNSKMGESTETKITHPSSTPR